MSLINEALKKAQRQRQQALAPPPPFAGHAPPAARARPRSTHSLLLLGAAGLSLIGLSVAATVFLLNRNPPLKAPVNMASKPAAAAPAAAPAAPSSPVISLGPVSQASPAPAPADSVAPPASAGLSPTPSLVTTRTPPPLATAAATPVPLPAEGPSRLRAAKMPSEAAKVALAPSILMSAESGSGTPSSLAPAPAISLPLPTTSPAQPPPGATRDDRVQAFLDDLRVAGLRAFGDGSRVLMNDRVYRVGDIVERQLGLRLSTVEATQLTFTDANGFNYVKRL